jgi:hypothetical protein
MHRTASTTIGSSADRQPRHLPGRVESAQPWRITVNVIAHSRECLDHVIISTTSISAASLRVSPAPDPRISA